MARPKGYEKETFGQVRWSCYLNTKLFDYQLATDSEQAVIPDMTGGIQVQDATFRLKDGSVYTKYNFADYTENHFVHGMTGKDGGYGAYVVMGSNEYLGGPNKQYLTIHSGPIIHRFLHSGHFLPRGIAHPDLPEGWSKLTGPWFIYFNKKESVAESWKDAKACAEKEKADWPYIWLKDAEYPLERGTATGRVVGAKGPIKDALVVMTTPHTDWQVQILDYNFSTRTDANGKFSLGKLRPGKYQLVVHAPGHFEMWDRQDVEVKANGELKFGDIALADESKKVVWQIGYPDRFSKEFNLSNEPRQYGLEKKVPANLTYTVGKSQDGKDWYYCQCNPGEWKVAFDAKPSSGQLTLKVGVAGQTNKPDLEVFVNGKSIGKVETAENSSAQYRSAVWGSSYYEFKSLKFDASLLKSGANEITFRLRKGAIHYDAIQLVAN
jgi:rhamnogalacturonan endolyase